MPSHTTSKPTGSFISYMSNLVKREGGINLAQGLPGFEPPRELLDGLAAIVHEPIHQYAPGAGDFKLIEELVEGYRTYGFKSDNFLVTCGATEALTLLFTYIQTQIEGPFSSLAFAPVYEAYGFLPTIFKSGSVNFSLEKDGSIDFERLEKTIVSESVRVIFVASPGNPYGKIFSREEFDHLIKLAHTHNIWVIIDAVYQDLYFTSKPPYIPLDQLDSKIIYTNSFSKKLCISGWRIGYIIATCDTMLKIKAIRDYTAVSSSSILQRAIGNYLGSYENGTPYIAGIRSLLKESFSLLHKTLADLNFKIAPHIDGGYFIWTELPTDLKSKDGFDFAMDLYKQQKVAVVPGENFGREAINYVRFNVAHPLSKIEQASLKIKEYFGSC